MDEGPEAIKLSINKPSVKDLWYTKQEISLWSEQGNYHTGLHGSSGRFWLMLGGFRIDHCFISYYPT